MWNGSKSKVAQKVARGLAIAAASVPAVMAAIEAYQILRDEERKVDLLDDR